MMKLLDILAVSRTIILCMIFNWNILCEKTTLKKPAFCFYGMCSLCVISGYLATENRADPRNYFKEKQLLR